MVERRRVVDEHEPMENNNTNNTLPLITKILTQPNQPLDNSATIMNVPVGHTRSGHYFTVPQTRGFFEYFVQGKINMVDALVAASCLLGVAMARSGIFPRVYFLLLFVFWRCAYNIGVGFILKQQSSNEWFTDYMRKLFEVDNDFVQAWVKPAILTKMEKDYSFQSMPVEYNAWLVFRMLVDLVLFHDAAYYCIFVYAYCDESTIPRDWMDVLRILSGLALVGFNIWVKSDAHRVVKDYAWYWGDFFFLLDGSLTFDGVFELAPHPMYSLGYVAYYGMSLISKSYTVFSLSLAAHFLQMAFLVFVETPHMDKIYGNHSVKPNDRSIDLRTGPSPMFHRDMVLFFGFDPRKATDAMTALFVFSTILVHALGILPVWFVIVECILWRLVYSGILGYVLWSEDCKRAWTRHYIKWGHSTIDAFNNWKALYNFSLLMNYTMYLITAFYVYTLPSEWTIHGLVLRHVLGLLMIGLQIWTGWSIYEGLGEFGWFYGDFFILPKSGTFTPSLTYAGIYRYLNNPEKIVGQAAYWGLALIAYDIRLVLLALLALVSNYIFLEWVERPHMQKVYGGQVRSQSGVTKTVRKVPGAESVVQVVEVLEEALEQPVSRIVHNVKDLVREARQRISTSPTFETITKHHASDSDDDDGDNHSGRDGGFEILMTEQKFQLADQISFILNSTLEIHHFGLVKMGRLLYKIPRSACIQSKVESLTTIPSKLVPWISGKFQLCALNRNNIVASSRSFEIYSNPVVDSEKSSIASTLNSLLTTRFPEFPSFTDTLKGGPNHLVFHRLSEAISTLFKVELAPNTVFQYASDPQLLAERILSAATFP